MGCHPQEPTNTPQVNLETTMLSETSQSNPPMIPLIQVPANLETERQLPSGWGVQCLRDGGFNFVGALETDGTAWMVSISQSVTGTLMTMTKNVNHVCILSRLKKKKKQDALVHDGNLNY